MSVVTNYEDKPGERELEEGVQPVITLEAS